MQVTEAFSFLVHPSKNADTQPEVGGTTLRLEGQLFDMLQKAFDKADEECAIDIAFESDGNQSNEVRTEVIELLRQRSLEEARALARRLQRVTTHRSGLGLLFVVIGRVAGKQRVYLTRFPADFGIVAKEVEDQLTVEFLEEVFLRNALSYKAVVFDDDSFDTGYWVGKAVDRQVSQGAIAISRYWIHDFLSADFRTTAIQGTRRLALAIKQTIESADDLEIKEELAAAARLVRSLDGQLVDMVNFSTRFGLSQKTQDAVAMTFANPSCRFDQFNFSAEEFAKHLRFRSVQVSNGATLTAPIGDFDACFHRVRVAEDGEAYTFTTTGRIVDEKLRKTP